MSDKKEILKQLLRKAGEKDCFSEALHQSSNSYQIKPYNIMKLSPGKIQEIYQNITFKFYNTNLTNEFDSWYQNELRVFIWILAVYSYIEQKSIENMGEADWKVFSEIFNGKSPDTFQFQALCLVKRRKSKKWNSQEIKMLTSIITSRTQKNKWNEIAKAMFTRSRKRFFRTPKQCREQWINHLDPSKIRSEWTALQDFQMITSIINVGKKWSLVARQLNNRRTQHMVKNRFKSLLKAELKRVDYEQKQQVLILKIRQRLVANAVVKKHLQQFPLYSKSTQVKESADHMADQSSQEGFEENQDCIEDSIYDQKEEQAEKEIDINQFQPNQPEQCQKIESDIKFDNVWDACDWKIDNMGSLDNVHNFLVGDDDLKYEKEFQNFFAPLAFSPFQFNF